MNDLTTETNSFTQLPTLLDYGMTLVPTYYEQPGFKEISSEYIKIWDELKSLLPTKLNLLSELDEIVSEKIAFESTMHYKKGFKDGANLIMEIKN